MFVVKALCAFPLLISLTTAYGQYGYPYAYPHTSTTGSTPPGIAPGSPAGSYALSGFDTINPYNGRLNFNLPLMQISGRGNAGYGMMLPIERNWQAIHTVSPICNQYGCDYGATAYHTYTAYIDWWNGLKPGYGPGVLIGRKTGKFPLNLPCSPPPWQFTLTRLTFTAADGTEYELRDKNSGGASLSNNGGCNGPGPSRGTEFSSTDGSAVTFVSDSTIYDASYGNAMFYPSGVLVMRDGTRYRIDNGRVSWIRDRNGNKTSYTYDIYNRITSSTDSLNRQVTITYAVTTNPDYDEIVFKGSGGANRSLRIYYASLGTRLRPGRNGCVNYDCYSLQTNGQLFPTLNGSSSTTFNPSVVSSVVLPDNRSYQFYYNSYGELARVDLPTGGVFEYDWTTATGNTGGEFWYSTNDNPLYVQEADIARRVKERRVYSDANTLEQKTTYGAIGVASQTVSYLKPDGTLISKEGHYYYGSPLYRPASPTDYPSWTDAREYRTDSFAADGTTLLRVSENEWQQGCGLPVFDSNVATNPRIASITSYLTDVSPNLVSKQTFSYDCYNNKTDVHEYDFGSGSFGSLVRRTHTDYVTTNNNANYATDTNIHLRSLPSITQVFDAANNKKAETQFEYDNYTPDANHAALVNRTNVSGFDTAFNTSYVTRGNVTKVSQWRSTDNAYLNVHSQYDIAGNIVKTIDANGNAINLEFNDRFGAPNGEAQSNTPPPIWLNGQTTFAFPTKVTNALGHIAYTQIDYFFGKPVDTEDPNNIKSSLYYNDVLDRPTKGIRAVGTSLQNQTLITYDDANKTITTNTDRDASTDGILQSKVIYDGLGRTYRKATYEGTLVGYANPQWAIVETQFDALGRAWRSSNPFRGDTPTVALPSNPEWTTSTFDALSRVTQVTTPDGAHVDTNYLGATVTVTDQAGKNRKSETDALGRLTKVWENPTGLNYLTSYSYDPLDNLTTVTQGVQTRAFVYDSLRRLTQATNPESGTTTYNYDNNGNLIFKQDALNRMTWYPYDALNRSQGYYTNDVNTPQVVHIYDTATLGKGKLGYSYTSSYWVGCTSWKYLTYNPITSYDVLGRPSGQTQYYRDAADTTWGTGYTTSRTYDLASNVKSQTYPSGHVVNYSYNTTGQLTTFSGNLGDGNSRTYVSNASYSAEGLKERESYGTSPTPLYLKLHYNKRQQMVDLRLGSVNDEWNWNRGALIFYYGTNAVNSWNPFANDTDNNGNVRRTVNYVPIDDAISNHVVPQLADYTYDELNRITNYNESQYNGSAWVYNVNQG
jgi:YD repeat-containing protein